MSEAWRPVRGYEGLYEVSDQGRVRSLDRIVGAARGGTKRMKSRVLQPRPLKRGYQRVSLSRDGRPRDVYIHRLVAEAFLGECPPGSEVCHRNGDPGDNRVLNLRWGSHGSNVQDTVTHGRHGMRNRVKCPAGHPLERPNLSRSSTSRHCLACHRASAYFRSDDPRFIEEANWQYSRIASGQRVRHIRPYRRRKSPVEAQP